jgi:phospholipid transport system substrate-binding protein
MRSRRQRRDPGRTLAAAAALVLCAGRAGAAAAGAPAPADGSAPVALIHTTIDDVLGILRDKSLSSKERRSRIENIAYQRFDFDTMSRLVIARYWSRFTPKQQVEFVEEFKSFLARTYGDRIDNYRDEKVEVVGERPEARGDVTVQTRIVGGEHDSAEVDYRLRQVGDAWRVIDVKIEGISLVLNYRDQFKSLLGRSGPEGLLDALRKKNSEESFAAPSA